MKNWVAIFVVSCQVLLLHSGVFASLGAPYKEEGCVVGGAVYSLYQGKKQYRLTMPQGFDPRPYEGKKVLLEGEIYPSDIFQPKEKTLRILGTCTAEAVKAAPAPPPASPAPKPAGPPVAKSAPPPAQSAPQPASPVPPPPKSTPPIAKTAPPQPPSAPQPARPAAPVSGSASGEQIRGRGGMNGQLRGGAFAIPPGNIGRITNVGCDGDGFWIEGPSGGRFSSPNEAVGRTLSPGNYAIFPNLKPKQDRAGVSISFTYTKAP